MGSLSSPSTPPHAVVFPFMSKGHTICILHFTRLLLSRGISTTVVTTPANRPFVAGSLADTSAAVIDIPFPANIPGIPDGIESTDDLPSMSLFFSFATATKRMQQSFESVLSTLLPVTFVVSDGFLGWTLQSARKFRIPRVVSYGMSAYAMTVSHVVSRQGPLRDPDFPDDEVFNLPALPRVRLTRNDFDSPFRDPDPHGPEFEFVRDQVIPTSQSEGVIINSFYEMEAEFVEYWNRECLPKAWCVGPLCLAEQPSGRVLNKHIHHWLDGKLAEGIPVLYVAFGSQAEIPGRQLKEIAAGLADSGVHFLWVMRRKMEGEDEIPHERSMDKGLRVEHWVDQRAILGHRSVRGFLSHCGWNSVMESLCAAVPLLALPLMADQHLNARMVTEEMGAGLRVETADGSVRGFVRKEELARSVRELMDGDRGKEVREMAKNLSAAAMEATSVRGSSWQSVCALIDHLRNKSAEWKMCMQGEN